MKKLEKYSGQKTYMYPNGSLATPEAVAIAFPAAARFTHVVETDEFGEVMFAMQNLAALRSLYGISSALPVDEAVAAIEAIINAPPPEAEISAEERIAAALEFQNVLSI